MKSLEELLKEKYWHYAETEDGHAFTKGTLQIKVNSNGSRALLAVDDGHATHLTAWYGTKKSFLLTKVGEVRVYQILDVPEPTASVIQERLVKVGWRLDEGRFHRENWTISETGLTFHDIVVVSSESIVGLMGKLIGSTHVSDFAGILTEDIFGFERDPLPSLCRE
jgi:hypothetical protein